MFIYFHAHPLHISWVINIFAIHCFFFPLVYICYVSFLLGLSIYTQQKRNAPLRHSFIVFNRMNAEVCKELVASCHIP